MGETIETAEGEARAIGHRLEDMEMGISIG
jgi:hypothetical protein